MCVHFCSLVPRMTHRRRLPYLHFWELHLFRQTFYFDPICGDCKLKLWKIKPFPRPTKLRAVSWSRRQLFTTLCKSCSLQISDYPSQVRQSLLRLLSSWSSPLTKSCLTPPPSAAQIDQFVTCHPVTPLPTWDICQYKNRDQAKALTRSILNWFRTEMVLCSWNSFFNSCGCGR